jgi:hypothetical protein
MERLPGVDLPALTFRPMNEAIYLVTAAQLVKNSSAGATQDINDFHRGRGGHQASRSKLVKMAKLLGITLTGKLKMCEACHVGLLIKTPIPAVSEMKAPSPGHLTFFDLSGPFPVAEPDSNFLYLCMFVDAASSRVNVNFIVRKHDIPTSLDGYFTAIKAAGYKAEYLCMDGDPANVTASVAKVLEKQLTLMP